jgi:spore maturation protein CgeB
MRICITNGTIDAINTNQRLRRRIAHGFEQLGHETLSLDVSDIPSEINRIRADFLLIIGSIADSRVDLPWIAQAAKDNGMLVAFWMHDDPYEFDLHWRLVGLECKVFTNEPNCVEYYPKEFHAQSLALAASPLDDIGHIYPSRSTEVDLGFCGVAFPQRVTVIRKLKSAGFSVECWGDGWPDDMSMGINQRLGPTGLHQLYRRCRFVLNLGREVSIANRRHLIAASMPGPRTFEAALSGAAQIYLCQSPLIQNYYQTHQGVFQLISTEEVADYVERARKDEGWLVGLQRAAREHTLRKHLYRHRCSEILTSMDLEDRP